jgi:hypothetical protein
MIWQSDRCQQVFGATCVLIVKKVQPSQNGLLRTRRASPMSSSSDSPSSSSPTTYIKSGPFYSDDAPTPSTDDITTASDLLLGAYDPEKLHPLAHLGDKLDYLLLDDDKTTELPGAGTAIPSRGWGDDLCYGTGTTYLSGAWLSFCFLFPLILFPVRGSPLRPTPRLSPYLNLPNPTPYSSYCLSPSHVDLTYSRFGRGRPMGHT